MGEQPLCAVCQKRAPDTGLVDDACRARLHRLLHEIPDLYAELTADVELVEYDGVLVLDDGTFDGPIAYDVMRLAPGPLAAAGNTGRVSGTPEAPVPVNLDVIDLTARAHGQNGRDSMVPLTVTQAVTINVRRVEVVTVVHEQRNADGEKIQRRERVPVVVHERQKRVERVVIRSADGKPVLVPAGDQIGHLPIASVLEAWVRDWRGHRSKGEGWPGATIPDMARWLDDRLDDACDDHPAIDEFADDIDDTHRALRGVLGEVGPWPELLAGVPCRRCDTRALFRNPPKEYGVQQYIECAECGDLQKPEEYERWTQLLAASVKSRARGAA